MLLQLNPLAKEITKLFDWWGFNEQSTTKITIKRFLLPGTFSFFLLPSASCTHFGSFIGLVTETWHTFGLFFFSTSYTHTLEEIHWINLNTDDTKMKIIIIIIVFFL